MTDLHFPGGMVRIEPLDIWKKLSEWSAREQGDVLMRPLGDDGFSCRLFVGDRSWSAKSRLSLADAVANALQAADYARFREEP